MAIKKDDKVGGSCTVTSGPNKGKKGKYTRDNAGNLWCEGSWGGTQCVSKCKSELAHTSVYEYEDANGTFVHEVVGIFEVEGIGVIQSSVIMDAATGKSLDISTTPVTVPSLADIQKSGSEVECRAANAIEAHLKCQNNTS